jgi:hypothetical protein
MNSEDYRRVHGTWRNVYETVKVVTKLCRQGDTLMGECDFYLADSTPFHVVADEASNHGDFSMRLAETRWMEARDEIEPPSMGLQTLPFSFRVPRHLSQH